MGIFLSLKIFGNVALAHDNFSIEKIKDEKR